MYKVYVSCIVVGCALILVSLVGVGYIAGMTWKFHDASATAQIP